MSLMRRRRPQLVLRWLAGWLEPHLPPRTEINVSNSRFHGVPNQLAPLMTITTEERR